MDSKHLTLTTSETKAMTPKRLKEYQNTLKDYWTYWPHFVNHLIKDFVRERIQDERQPAAYNNPT